MSKCEKLLLKIKDGDIYFGKDENTMSPAISDLVKLLTKYPENVVFDYGCVATEKDVISLDFKVFNEKIDFRHTETMSTKLDLLNFENIEYLVSYETRPSINYIPPIICDFLDLKVTRSKYIERLGFTVNTKKIPIDADLGVYKHAIFTEVTRIVNEIRDIVVRFDSIYLDEINRFVNKMQQIDELSNESTYVMV